MNIAIFATSGIPTPSGGGSGGGDDGWWIYAGVVALIVVGFVISYVAITN